MRNLILFGVGALLLIVLLPGFLSGGSEGAKDAGGSAAGSLADTVKNPDAVGDAAGKVVDPVVEVASPWWDALYRQPWFWGAVLSLGVAIAVKKWWDNMGGTARLITVGAGVFAFMFIIMAFVA